MGDHLRALINGNAALFEFYFRHLLSPFSTLPPELYDEGVMGAKMAEQKPFTLVVSNRYADEYARGLRDLQRRIDDLWHGGTVDPMTKQILFWCVRACTVAAAVWTGSLRLVVAISLLQFILLPYSLFVALAYGAETVFVLYTGHTLVFPLLTCAVRSVLPASWYAMTTVTLQPCCLVAFFVADQLVCARCLWSSPKGKTARVPAARVAASIAYGFANCKTYYLVLLPLCVWSRLQVPLVPWALDACLGLSARVASVTAQYWQVLFYHVHRMGHLKHVYPDAHKFHHFLHDTTPFDAHIFGSGAPEEWLLLMADLCLACGLGVLPACLSRHVLGVSYYNKWGFHTRNDQPPLHADNFHADHHARHVTNFGFTYPYELLMNTAPAECHGVARWAGFTIERHDHDGSVHLVFTPQPLMSEASGRTVQSRDPGQETAGACSPLEEHSIHREASGKWRRSM